VARTLLGRGELGSGWNIRKPATHRRAGSVSGRFCRAVGSAGTHNVNRCARGAVVSRGAKLAPRRLGDVLILASGARRAVALAGELAVGPNGAARAARGCGLGVGSRGALRECGCTDTAVVSGGAGRALRGLLFRVRTAAAVVAEREARRGIHELASWARDARAPAQKSCRRTGRVNPEHQQAEGQEERTG
jgi:hypothetical protein